MLDVVNALCNVKMREIAMDKILVTKPTMPSLEEYVDEIKSIWQTHWLTNMGEKHIKFQKTLCDFCEVENVELFTNGHMALELSLQSLDLKGEVITTPFTFISTTNAIVRSGLKPVFCDINNDDFTIDVNRIESLINENTCAILPVHVYGNICDIDAIKKIADKYDLKIIYDAAHAFGEIRDGKNIAGFGDITCFSFHATKVFNSIEGGAAIYHDKSIGKKLRYLKNFGIYDEDNVNCIGTNAKMNEFSAAMGICNLRHLKDDILARKNIYYMYKERLQDISGLQLNVAQDNVVSNYAYFPIVVHPHDCGFDRNDILMKLRDNNICARKYFYPLTSSCTPYVKEYDSTLTPVAKNISENVLTLPIYPDLAFDDVERICNLIVSLTRI